MKKNLKRIISIMLMTGILITTAVVVMPPSRVYAVDPITVTASPDSQSGIPGSKLSYSITVVNGSTTSTVLDFEKISVKNWTTSIVGLESNVNVGANSSVTVIVEVTIPNNAYTGEKDVVTFTVKEGGGFKTSVTLTVNVVAPGADSNRPLLSNRSYSYGDKTPKAGSEFELVFIIENRGQISAYNYQVTFTGEGFFPRGTNGTNTIGNIEPGGQFTTRQTFLVGNDMAWTNVGSIIANITYTDASGKEYSGTIPLSIPLTSPYTGPAATATPKASLRPQLVITGNSTDINPLQPGSIFELTLDVKNLGSTDAKSVNLVFGGGANTTNELGTPQPGVSGSGADLTNFAPLGSSNIIVVGDIPQGSSISIKQSFVVNVTTVPGAYTLKTSFVYADEKANRFVDDQVITLLVYSLPQIEVNFYRDPGMLMAGMPNMLPLQVTNLGRKTSVLGNMKVTSNGADITNNVALVGALDPGGYFTLDSEAFPMQEGPLDILVTISYTDDFNMSREITQTLTLEVMPAQEYMPEDPNGLDPGMDPGTGFPVEPMTESFWGKVGRFFKGLLGLGSGLQQPSFPQGGEEFPSDDFGPSIVVPKG